MKATPASGTGTLLLPWPRLVTAGSACAPTMRRISSALMAFSPMACGMHPPSSSPGWQSLRMAQIMWGCRLFLGTVLSDNA